MTSDSGMALSQKGEGCQGVLHFAFSKVMSSGAEPNPSKIKAEYFTVQAEEHLGSRKHYFVVHGALVQRVWMANHCERRRVRALLELQKTFDAACRTVELNALDLDHIQCFNEMNYPSFSTVVALGRARIAAFLIECCSIHSLRKISTQLGAAGIRIFNNHPGSHFNLRA